MHHGVRIQDAALVAAAVLSHRYIADRFLPDKAVDLVDEAASRLRIELDSMPTEIDEIERQIMQLEMERQALKKEKDAASRERLGQASRRNWPTCARRAPQLKAQWQNEKAEIDKIAQAPGAARGVAHRARAGAAPRRSRQGERNPVRPHPAVAAADRGAQREAGRDPEGRPADAQGGGHRGGHRRGRRELDRHPRLPPAGRRAREAGQDGGAPRRARRRPEEGDHRRRQRRAPRPQRLAGPEPARSARSFSSARPASARRNWPARWRSFSSTTRTP